MPDTAITQLNAYDAASYPPAADHSADVFVIVDTIDQSMANSGSDKKLTISQFVSANGILDIALYPIAQGDLIYRDSTAWAVLAPGTSGYILATQGASANPVWRSQSGVLDGIGSTQGNILYRGASTWGALAPGTANYLLVSGGAAANPSWVANSVTNITGAAPLASPTFTGTVTLSTSTNLVLTDQASAPFVITAGTTYGTKLGGATSEKFGFYNATPVVQQSGDLLTSLTNLGLIASPKITHWTGGITTLTGDQTGTALNIDCSASNAFLVNLATGASPILTIQNLAIGQTVKITTLQPESGTVATITWGGQTIRWADGTTGTVTATLGKADTFSLYSPASGVIGGGVAIPNF